MLRYLSFIAVAVIVVSVYGYRHYLARPHTPLSLQELRTTDGGIALQNLEAQISGENRLAEKRPLTVVQQSGIIDLIAMRGQILGQISDYEKADALAQELVSKNPESGQAYLTRAHTRAIFHRFNDALADIETAEKLGLRGAPIESARVSILQATGQYDEALKARSELVRRNSNIQSLGSLAALYGEMGDLEKADTIFSDAPSHYRDVSPFPIAWLYFQQGVMWMRKGDFPRAREFLENAHNRVPAYKTAQGHLGEVMAELGDRKRAIELLRPLAEVSDDPDYAAQLARILLDDGQTDEASIWRDRAAARYDSLMSSHPEAFADHAAEFWLAAGADPKKALNYAEDNLRLRKTHRAYDLVSQARLKVQARAE